MKKLTLNKCIELRSKYVDILDGGFCSPEIRSRRERALIILEKMIREYK